METLLRYYPDTAQTLGSFVCDFPCTDTDHAFQVFLESTAICPDREINKTGRECASRLPALFNKCLLALLRGKKHNILTDGCRLGENNTIDFFYPNKHHAHFHTKLFRKLHSLVGDQLMEDILSHCSLFLSEGGTLFQISGQPLHTRHYKNKTRVRRGVGRKAVFYAHPRIENRRLSHKPQSLFCVSSPCEIARGITRNINKTEKTIELVKRIQKNIKAAPVFSILNTHCERSEKETPAANVFGFLKAAIKRIVPPIAFGGAGNKEKFFQKIKLFVCLSRYEDITAESLLRGIETKCLFLSSRRETRTEKIETRAETERLFSLLVTEIAIPLIRAAFYVTETTASQVVYFRHETWQKRSAVYLAKHKLLGAGTKNSQNPKLKLVPKKNSFREIICYQRDQIDTHRAALASIEYALKKTQKSQPPQKTLETAGIEEIREKLSAFKGKQTDSTRAFFCVTADIETCFDTIDQDRLCGRVEEMFGNIRGAEYNIEHYTTLSLCFNEVRKKHKAVLASLFFDGTIHGIDGNRPAVVVNESVPQKRKTKTLLKTILDLIRSTDVSFGRKTFRREKGIPQGAGISTALANIALSMADSLLVDMLSDETLLLRHVDDYLLVTRRRDVAEGFVGKIQKAIHGFGMKINKEKTLESTEEQRYIPWNCFLLDAHTLEVRAKETPPGLLSISPMRRNVRVMVDKIKKIHVLSLKRIFLDPALCGKQTVLENIRRILAATGERVRNYVDASDIELRKDMAVRIKKELAVLTYNTVKRTNKAVTFEETETLANTLLG
ncbi:MAG: telomerase reverse transcriptase [Amphiamblys sp. WSBS2006]|nr:MAG: telomerase reverse transcriptase [Amphiamblys sp. WSBS2006]